MSSRILHLFPDSPFLSFTSDIFETVAPGDNSFLVVGARGDLDRRRNARTAAVSMTALPAGDAGLPVIADAVADAEVVIAHSMAGIAIRAMAKVPATKLRVWSGWGGDYYGSDFSRMAGLLGPETARYHRSRVSAVGTVMQPYRRYRASRLLHRSARASDLFSAPVPEDYGVFRSRFADFRGEYAQLNYLSVEDTVAAEASAITGDDILVGNSATMTNNHFEVLELLASAGVGDRRVIVPLSYGDSRYADEVVKRGTALLGSRLVALRDFMPLQEYLAVVAGCSVVVMGHHRQQGVSNIAGALWAGAHVFLDDRNPVSRFLATRGARAGSLGDLRTAGLPAGRVDDAALEVNRTMLRDFWARDVVLDNTRRLLERV